MTCLNDNAKPYVDPLAQQASATIFLPCNVGVPGELEAVFDAIGASGGDSIFCFPRLPGPARTIFAEG